MRGYYGYGNSYAYPYVGQLPPPPQGAVVAEAGPVFQKLVEAFTMNEGHAPKTWLEIADFLFGTALETASEELPGAYDERRLAGELLKRSAERQRLIAEHVRRYGLTAPRRP